MFQFSATHASATHDVSIVQMTDQIPECPNDESSVTSQYDSERIDWSARIRVSLDTKMQWSNEDVHEYDAYDQYPVVDEENVR